jgi:hypothetical protein
MPYPTSSVNRGGAGERRQSALDPAQPYLTVTVARIFGWMVQI